MAVLFLIGRILFGGYFFRNGINHLRNYEMMAGYAASRSVPSPKAAVIGSGVLLLIGGVSIALGIFPVIGQICLLAFLIPVSFKMHSYWIDTDPQMKTGNHINFWKNMALFGAVLMLFAVPRPWPLSLLG